jgi:hypothetical protein
VLITGRPLGARYGASADTLEFVRDPDGAFGRPELSKGFAADARVPDEAVDTGFRRGDTQLWHIPSDSSAVWLVEHGRAERWPAGTTPVCA